MSLLSAVGVEHLRLLDAVRSDGAEAAYRDRLLVESLDEWMNTPSWSESVEFLRTHPGLLDDDGIAAAQELAEDRPADTSVVLHAALLPLVRRLGSEAAFGCLGNRQALHRLVQQAVQLADPELLAHASTIELIAFEDAFPSFVHRLAAGILVGRPDDSPLALLAGVADHCTTENRDRCTAEIAALIGRAPEHAIGLSTLLQAVLATVPAS